MRDRKEIERELVEWRENPQFDIKELIVEILLDIQEVLEEIKNK